MTTMREFDASTLDTKTLYRLMISVIVPRPIALVSTSSPSGQVNLAPFSFFMGVSSQPPCLAFSIAQKPSNSEKDTLVNIRQTREFVVNSSQEHLATAINQTSAEYPYGVDEMAKSGLHPLPSLRVHPPRVAECGVQMECQLYQLVPVGHGVGSATLVIGEILLVHVDPNLLEISRSTVDGPALESTHSAVVDPNKLRPLSRLGGLYYGKTPQVFEMVRPTSRE